MGVPVEITPRRQGLQLKCESAYPKFPLQKSLIQTSGCRPGGQWTKTCLISSSSTHIPSCGWQASAVSAKDHVWTQTQLVAVESSSHCDLMYSRLLRAAAQHQSPVPSLMDANGRCLISRAAPINTGPPKVPFVTSPSPNGSQPRTIGHRA